MDPLQRHRMNVDNQHQFDWFCVEEPFLRDWDLNPPLLTQSLEYMSNSFFEFEPLAGPSMDLIPLPDNKDYVPHLEFKDFDDFNYDFLCWEDSLSPFQTDAATDIVPFNTIDDHFCPYDMVGINDLSAFDRKADSSHEFCESKNRSGRMKSIPLEFEEIQKHFNVPITIAAKEMKVGLTALKKRCRELNITRWPHRKIKSLTSLINNVKELGLTKEVQVLEEHKRQLQTLPEMELTEKTKKLRQACFKANYKKRRCLLPLPPGP